MTKQVRRRSQILDFSAKRGTFLRDPVLRTFKTLHGLLKFDNRQFYRESFEIIFNNDVAFGYKLISIVKITQSDPVCRSGVGPEIDHVLHDSIICADGYVDG